MSCNSLDRDSIYSNSDVSRERRQRSKSQHKKKSKDGKKQKKKKHKRNKQKDKDKGEAAGPVQLSKVSCNYSVINSQNFVLPHMVIGTMQFMQEDTGGKEGRYSAVSGKKVSTRINTHKCLVHSACKALPAV